MSGHGRLVHPIPALVIAALVAAGCGQTAPAASAKPATASTAAATAAAAAPTAKPFIPVGKFAVAPTHAAWGGKAMATATGLSANTAYDVVWTDVVGSWKLSESGTGYKGRTFKETRTTLTSAKSDAAGAFSVPFTVPTGFGFTHDVLVVKGDETVNKSGFDVDMEVSYSPTSGPVGTPISVEVRGIGWRDLQNSWELEYDNKFTGWISSVTTKGYAKFQIPATGSVGAHIFTIIHGHQTMPYLNMQQSPQPDRPLFRLPFTITAGDPVLPGAAGLRSLADIVTLPDKGSFWFEPQQGAVGSMTTLYGKGLPANTELDLVWTNPSGTSPVAGSRPETSTVVGKARTTAAGDLKWIYTVPDEWGGFHSFEARNGDKALASTKFLVVPTVQPLSVDHGPVGTKFSIQINGMYATETGRITHLDWDNSLAGYSCSFNTNGNIRIDFVAAGDVGWHFIDLYPGLHVGEETTPYNYHIAQLTGDVDHAGERMPIWHFAFLITP